MGRLLRLCAAAGLGSVGVWLSAAAVLAAGNPAPTPIPPPPTIHDYYCGQALGVITLSADADSWMATQKTFAFGDGTVVVMFTGHQRTIVQGAGKVLTYDSSGPGFFTIHPDGTVTITGTGHLFYVGPPGSPQAGIFVYSGTNVIDISDPTDAVVSSYSGHKLDVCAVLAA